MTSKRTETFVGELEQLEVLPQFRSAGLKLKTSKWVLFQNSVT